MVRIRRKIDNKKPKRKEENEKRRKREIKYWRTRGGRGKKKGLLMREY